MDFYGHILEIKRKQVTLSFATKKKELKKDESTVEYLQPNPIEISDDEIQEPVQCAAEKTPSLDENVEMSVDVSGKKKAMHFTCTLCLEKFKLRHLLHKHIRNFHKRYNLRRNKLKK